MCVREAGGSAIIHTCMHTYIRIGLGHPRTIFVLVVPAVGNWLFIRDVVRPPLGLLGSRLRVEAVGDLGVTNRTFHCVGERVNVSWKTLLQPRCFYRGFGGGRGEILCVFWY